MENQPLVSVILTVYNGSKFLRQALESIFSQSYSHFELIVVDDASTDNTPDILANYTDPRVHILRNDKNCGPYQSANNGIRLAKGQFVARHDADDVSLPDRFRLQVERMLSEPSLGLLGTSYHLIDSAGKIIDTSIMPTRNDELQVRILEGNIFCQGTVMIRKEIAERIGFYRDDYPVSQDYDLWLRLAEKSRIANLATPLYLFRFHPESISRTKRELQLACKQFALDLAQQRRSGGQEMPLPEDVMLAYPPHPINLFLDARGTAFLYYSSGIDD